MTKIPAMTKIGGQRNYKSKTILEFRVWVHPKKCGDDYYYNAKTFVEILRIRKSHLNEGRCEKPIGVVKDKDGSYREVILVLK